MYVILHKQLVEQSQKKSFIKIVFFKLYERSVLCQKEIESLKGIKGERNLTERKNRRRNDSGGIWKNPMKVIKRLNRKIKDSSFTRSRPESGDTYTL
jgi:hypothetical protein